MAHGMRPLAPFVRTIWIQIRQDLYKIAPSRAPLPNSSFRPLGDFPPAERDGDHGRLDLLDLVYEWDDFSCS